MRNKKREISGRKKINKKLLALLVVFFITFGYAALTGNLRIDGLTNIKKNTWSIYFDNIQTSNKNTVTASKLEIEENKTIVDYNVELSKPGDHFSFTVDVINDGSIDAMINLIDGTKLTDAQKKAIEYSITYDNGQDIQKFDGLKAGEKDTVLVEIGYKKDINKEDLLLEQDLELSLTIEYIQADDKARIGSFTGILVDENDNVIPNEYLAVYSDTPHFVKTKDDGSFTVNKLEAGEHEVYYSGTKSLEGNTKDVVISQAIATTTFQLTDKYVKINGQRKIIIKDNIESNPEEENSCIVDGNYWYNKTCYEDIYEYCSEAGGEVYDDECILDEEEYECKSYGNYWLDDTKKCLDEAAYCEYDGNYWNDDNNSCYEDSEDYCVSKGQYWSYDQDACYENVNEYCKDVDGYMAPDDVCYFTQEEACQVASYWSGDDCYDDYETYCQTMYGYIEDDTCITDVVCNNDGKYWADDHCYESEEEYCDIINGSWNGEYCEF